MHYTIRLKKKSCVSIIGSAANELQCVLLQWYKKCSCKSDSTAFNNAVATIFYSVRLCSVHRCSRQAAHTNCTPHYTMNGTLMWLALVLEYYSILLLLTAAVTTSSTPTVFLTLYCCTAAHNEKRVRVNSIDLVLLLLLPLHAAAELNVSVFEPRHITWYIFNVIMSVLFCKSAPLLFENVPRTIQEWSPRKFVKVQGQNSLC
jgi:hypothetical protein